MPENPISLVPPGLVFTHDGMPGYRRMRRGKGFAFYLPDGSLLQCVKERRRILSLAIPPAYTSVWVCVKANGHLQATGLDQRGRKQYRYHPEWSVWSGSRKFDDLSAFARALPKIRARAKRLLDSGDLSRERIIAAVVTLLDRTGYRIGNARYTKENGSYGLSSLLSRHARPSENGWELHFRGKSGMMHDTEVSDPRVGQVIEELQELPGQHLFRYQDEDGGWRDLDSGDVNAWLKEAGVGEFTAKQFRTWRATVICAKLLGKFPPAETRAARTRARNEAIRQTAALLNHRPATCRKYYVHPSLFAAYRSGLLHRVMTARAPALRRKDGTASLTADERRVFRVLEKGAALQGSS